MNNTVTYRIGIDVGLRGVGLAAIAVDPDGVPIKILNSVVVLHDSGVDPEHRKAAVSRRAVSGMARRTRRLFRRRRFRLQRLDKKLTKMGFPIVDTSRYRDPYIEWRVREELAKTYEPDDQERKRKVSMAVRHLARHRGWRNPYHSVSTLYSPAPDSGQFIALKNRVAEKLGLPGLADEGVTPGQVVAMSALDVNVKLRGEKGILEGKLMQSDYANELRLIAEVQQLPADQLKAIIDVVFHAESPRGSAAKLAGRDSLPGREHLPRAPKAVSAFQEFRIASVLANMRIRTAGTRNHRRLSIGERTKAFDYLSAVKPTADPTWNDVAERLGIDRGLLVGSAVEGVDGERPSARPPVDETSRRVLSSELETLVDWWKDAMPTERDAMVKRLSYGDATSESSEAAIIAEKFLSEIDEGDAAKIDVLALPPGRAAYSEQSLKELTKQMLSSEDDLHDARMRLFKIDQNWRPPAEPIGMPVGNPAVDRVTKIISRWLEACCREWGDPISVNIEHVRNGLLSEASVRKDDKEAEARYKKRLEQLADIQHKIGLKHPPRRSDVLRFEAITRQNAQCAYCGEGVTYATAEMDHIIPRAGKGSTNTRDNLVAACVRCNKSKSNSPFSVWAETCGIDGVSLSAVLERTRHWLKDSSDNAEKSIIAGITARLKRTELDPEIDSRSMESVAWMANEIRERIDQRFGRGNKKTSVAVYRGQLTAEARKASGMEGRVNLIRGPERTRGKNRFDRRHHAMDAVAIAMMEPGISQTLAERLSIREAERITGDSDLWKRHWGESDSEKSRFLAWRDTMSIVTDLFNEALENDHIPVTASLRLRLENGAAHKATVKGLKRLPLGQAMSLEQIDRAETPALWCALTRDAKFDAEAGLPEDPHRTIMVNGVSFTAEDEIGFFNDESACVAVRGGYVSVGDSVHHARIYRVTNAKGKSSYFMLRVYTADLTKHAKRDLFSVEIPAHSISMRVAPKALRKAISDGAATYVGWLVVNDEIKIDMPSGLGTHMDDFNKEVPGIKKWRIAGFPESTKLRLRPVVLAGEGCPDSFAGADYILNKKGWIVSVNKLFLQATPLIIRRDVLGRPRMSSVAHLPVCWKMSQE